MTSRTDTKRLSVDCRNCNRRRILCDRSGPSCNKCVRKGLTCAGTGPNVRWVEGVAVRGRFKGSSVSAMATAGCTLQDPLQTITPSLNLTSLLTSSTETQSTMTMSLPPEHVLDQLIDHYATHICPLMVWLDSDKNEYRRLVIPLAKAHSTLQLAISAISVAHRPIEPLYDSAFSRQAYEAAIVKITEQVRRMNGTGQVHDNEEVSHIDGLLAALLLLTNQSLLGYELSHVRFHRQAIRVLIRSLPRSRCYENELCAFLKNQAAYFDIMTCTTIFDHESINNVILPAFGTRSSLFAHFLTVIHRVTTLSSELNSVEKRYDESLLFDLEKDFMLAQGKNCLAAAEVLQGKSDEFQDDFIRMNQTYFHAGMIYACRRLNLRNTQFERENYLRLIRTLKQFDNIQSWVHNLPWPTFIAGTIACTDEENQRFITELCDQMCIATRYKHYRSISNFLCELWQTPGADWIVLARDREASGESILVC